MQINYKPKQKTMKKLTLLLALTMILLSCEKSEQLQTEIIDFYNWDMTSVNEMIVYNPIDLKRIERYNVTVWADFENNGLGTYDFEENGLIEFNTNRNRIIMTIDTLGIFNTDLFISTEQSRGQIIIRYY